MFLFIIENFPKVPGVPKVTKGAKRKEKVEQKKRQVKKGRRWMPRLLEAKKDVTSCEKPGLGANNRMTPGSPNGATHYESSILATGSKRRELKHLSTCRKRKQK